MGLDIRAYQNLIPVENPELDEDGLPIDSDLLEIGRFDFQENEWPGRAEGLPPHAVCDWEDYDHFHAGSYGYYSFWRNQLAMIAGYKNAEDCWDNHDSGPFYQFCEPRAPTAKPLTPLRGQPLQGSGMKASLKRTQD